VVHPEVQRAIEQAKDAITVGGCTEIHSRRTASRSFPRLVCRAEPGEAKAMGRMVRVAPREVVWA
jgi:hypothetical protein